MIVHIVGETESCIDCPNMESEQIKGKKYRYICNAQRRILASDYDPRTVLAITDKIDKKCPFAKDEVNQRQRRGR